MSATDRLAAIRAREQAARRPMLPHYDFHQQRDIDRARYALVNDVRHMAAALDAVFALAVKANRTAAPGRYGHLSANEVIATINDALGGAE